jgi:hypothetical protein
MNNKKKVLIRNPDSGRLISIKGKKGKEVLKKLKDENKDIDYIVRIKGENYKKKDYLNQEESLKTTQVKENQEESLQHNQVKEKQENLEKQNPFKKQKNKIRVKIIPISHISHNPFYKTRSSFPNNGIPQNHESLGTILRFVQTNMKII